MSNYDAMYRENSEIVYRYIFSLTQDSNLAEELTQQTFFEVLRHPENFREDSAVSTYLCGIAKNLLKKEWLQRKKRRAYIIGRCGYFSVRTLYRDLRL